MSLKLDKTHKQINSSFINDKNRRKINVSIGSVLLSLTMLSGCGKTINANAEEYNPITSSSITDEYDELDTVNLSGVVEVEFDNGEKFYGTSLSYKDLSRIKSITITLTKNNNYDYLNYLSNLKNLKIIEFDAGNYFNNIDGSKFSKGINIELNTLGYSGAYVFSLDKYPFIKDISNINSLVIGNDTCSYDLSSLYANSLDNVNEMTLYIDEFSALNDFNFSSKLKKLNIKGKPYDIAMFITSNDLNILNNSNIEVNIENYEKVVEIIKELDDIYNDIDIKDSDSSIEKMDKLLVCILERFNYDSGIASKGDSLDYSNDLTSFYKNGELDASLNNETQICGNYASMFYTLCRRANLNNYFLISENHAWNAVEVGDYYYYVDSAWLDGTTFIDYVEGKEVEITSAEVIKSNDRDKLNYIDWYLESPTNVKSKDENNSHVLEIYPVVYEVESVPEEVRRKAINLMLDDIETTTVASTTNTIGTTTTTTTSSVVNEDISSKEYKVVYKGITYTLKAAALIGLLSSIGIGTLVHNKKKKKKEELKRRVESFDDIDFSNDTFQEDYDKFHNSYH